MSETLKQRAGIVYQVAESVILAISVGLVAWTANTVISQGHIIAAINNQVLTNTGRLDNLENKGSSGLREHEKMDDNRIVEMQKRDDRLEAALNSLMSTPGELKAINIRLDGANKALERIESILYDRSGNGNGK